MKKHLALHHVRVFFCGIGNLPLGNQAVWQMPRWSYQIITEPTDYNHEYHFGQNVPIFQKSRPDILYLNLGWL